MAGGKSNYLNNKILNLIFNQTAYTGVATVYAALFTVTPSDSAAGTEVSGGSYARVAITANTTNFPTTTTQSISNGTAIIFPTATGSWGTVVAGAIMDALTTGNMLYWGPLGSSVTVNTGNVFEYLVGAAVFTES